MSIANIKNAERNIFRRSASGAQAFWRKNGSRPGA
jgi:hypothetical protein